MHISKPPSETPPDFSRVPRQTLSACPGAPLLSQSRTKTRPLQHASVHTEIVNANKRWWRTGGTHQGEKQLPVTPSAPSLARGEGQTGSGQTMPSRDAGIAHATWRHLRGEAPGRGSSLETAGLQREADQGTWRKSECLCNHLLPTQSESKPHQSVIAKGHLSASMVPSQHQEPLNWPSKLG